MIGAELVPRFEAWAQEELGVQQALRAALESHERVLGRGRPDEIESSLLALDAVDPRGAQRRRELEALMRELAQRWGLAAETLSLGSIATRFGERGVRLARLRAELRAACEEVRDRGRRLSLVARQQRAVVVQVLESVLGREGLDGTRSLLVDSKA